MENIRIGLVGYGSWTREAYVPALRRDGRASVVCAAARTKGTRERVREFLGPGVTAYPGIEEMLVEERLDAVMIAVPDWAHEETLLAAVDRNVAVFYEPPISDSRKRIRSVLDRLLSAQHVTFADLELGLTPVVRRTAEAVRSGMLGELQRTSICLRSGWGPVPDYDLCNFNHLCTWYVDVLNRVVGSNPRRVLLLDGHGTPGRRQNHFIGHLDYGGSWGTFKANIASVGPLEIAIEVEGEDGDLRANILTGEVQICTRGESDWRRERWPAILPHASWPGVHEAISTFLDCVTSGVSEVNGAEVVAQLQLVGFAAEEAFDTGTWAEVKSGVTA